jgi:hypothetical protein
MSTYTLTQSEFTSLKRRLTQAQVKLKNATASGYQSHEAIEEAADKLIAEADRAFRIFEEKGYPDDWARWERAKDDARVAKLMKTGRGGRL